MENNLEKINETIFESIKHIDDDGNEYWEARELQTALDYKEWRKFEGVIKKAMQACEISNYNTSNHFVGADKIVNTGVSAKKSVIINYQGMHAI